MEENLYKKRLGVFRAITRDISPDIFPIPTSSDSTVFKATEESPQISIASSIPDCPNFSCKPSGSLDPLPPVSSPLQEPSSRLFISQNKVKKDLKPNAWQCERKSLVPNFVMNKIQNIFYDSPMNSSGSFSSRSFVLNNSTEESSREENDERRKPKKRPLEECEKNFYVIKLPAIVNGNDSRTTVMIKNIPNKYTQKMLLQTINKKFAGTYDFLYLPIDFKVKCMQNKCNVGYAFINFSDFHFIEPFFHEFNAKRWERFNSEKVCALAYARIQGLHELVQHFQNSSVINQEDNKVKPIILAKN